MKTTVAVVVAIVAIIALLYVATVPNSAPAPEMTEAEIAQVQADVEAVADEMMTAYNNLDVEAAAALLDTSSMDGHDGSTYYANYDEWVAHFQDMFGRFEEMNGEWTSKRVDVLAPDVALLVGQNSMDVTQVGGARTNIHGFITVVLKKIDGQWKMIHQASVGRWTPIEGG